MTSYNSKAKLVNELFSNNKLSISWVKKMVGLGDDIYCPFCYTDRIIPNKDTWEPECECGWKGNMENLLSENEAKNTKRIKLIDKMI